ncbi:MAG: YbfB/YjiJ family MFS transporter [Hyphomicrobiales bacterium]
MPNDKSTFRVTVVGLVSLAIAMGIGRFAFTPLLPMMQDDGLVTIGGGGVLASVHFLGYLMGAVSAAWLPGAHRTLMRGSLLAIGVATLSMGLSENFALWAVLRFLAGLCSAWTLVLISNHCIKTLSQAGRSDRHGWVFSGVGAGIAVAGFGCVAMMAAGTGSAQGWQVFGAIALVAIAMLCVQLGPEFDGSRPAHKHAPSKRSPLVWSVIAAYGATGLGYVIPATYLPVMARAFVQSPLVFGWSWPIFGAAAFVSTLFAARLYRRFSNRQIWIASQIVMAAGLLLPVIYADIASIVIAGLCVGGTFMIVTMAGMKEAHAIAPPEDVVRHIAALTAAFAAGQMIGPVFAGALYEWTQSFTLALISTSLVLIATAGVLWRDRASASLPQEEVRQPVQS